MEALQEIQLPEEHHVKDKEQIVREHIDLVHKIARNYSQMANSQYDDLVQVGSIGLLHAIDRYDAKYKTQFRTYAAHVIISEIKHYLRDHIPLVRPPRELQELGSKIRNTEQHLLHLLGRDPTDEELTKSLDISIDKLNEARTIEKTIHCLSLDQEMSATTDGTTSMLDYLEDKKYRSFQLSQEDRFILMDALTVIRGQSRQIIEFAFYQDLTQTEIAKHLGISQMQVSRRLKSALNELWTTLNTRVTPW